MGNPHQFRVSQVHESDGKFPAFHGRFTGSRVFQIHGTVYLKSTVIYGQFYSEGGICYQMGLTTPARPRQRAPRADRGPSLTFLKFSFSHLI